MTNQNTSPRERKSYFGRYRQIAMVLVKYRLGDFIKTFGLQRFLPFHLVPPSNPWHKDQHTTAQRSCMALEELGTTFVKVGQILSTRTDILPPDFTQELSKLQSSLKPVPLEDINNRIKQQLGKPLEEIFASFDPKPLGVASIGQAHAATLHDGTAVVVKARKPGVWAQVSEDLEILRQLAMSARTRSPGLHGYDLVNLVLELSDTMRSELDYVREGHSAEHFANFFKDNPCIHIPKIFWEYTTPKVITMERIQGISILDIAALDAAGHNRKELAQRCVDIWVKMVFEDTVFHADPHPGNVFVESDGRLGVIDFGMIGLIDEEVRDRMVSASKAIIDRDVDLLIDSLTDRRSGTCRFAGDTPERPQTCHGEFPRTMEELNLTSNLGDLFAVVRRNYVQLPANTFMLLKTMAMVQSLGKGLDSDFDFFAVMRPHVEEMMKSKFAPSAILARIPAAALQSILLGIGLPARLSRIIKSVERGELRIRTDSSMLEGQMRRLERLVIWAVGGIMIVVIFLGISILLT